MASQVAENETFCRSMKSLCGCPSRFHIRESYEYSVIDDIGWMSLEFARTFPYFSVSTVERYTFIQHIRIPRLVRKLSHLPMCQRIITIITRSRTLSRNNSSNVLTGQGNILVTMGYSRSIASHCIFLFAMCWSTQFLRLSLARWNRDLHTSIQMIEIDRHDQEPYCC